MPEIVLFIASISPKYEGLKEWYEMTGVEMLKIALVSIIKSFYVEFIVQNLLPKLKKVWNQGKSR